MSVIVALALISPVVADDRNSPNRLAVSGLDIGPDSGSGDESDASVPEVSNSQATNAGVEDAPTSVWTVATESRGDISAIESTIADEADTTDVTATTEQATTSTATDSLELVATIDTTAVETATSVIDTDSVTDTLDCVAHGTERVVTDQADYPPGATVQMTGSGFAPRCVVRVEVTRPDGSVVRGDGSFTPGVDEVVTTATGTFSYAYRLNGIEGLYRIRVLGDGGVVLASTTFTDQLRSTPSDPRATFHEGNVVTCAGAGFPGRIQMGSPSNGNASDPNVSGTVAPNSGPIQPGQGQEVDVTITGVGVVIDAVVVKGGNGYNVYSNPQFLPPTLAPPQHYISPLNGPAGSSGQVPEISHWFVCYHLATPPPVGSLTVHKTVIAPDGIPVTPLPTGFTVLVNCNDGIHVNIPLTFGVGGGRAVTDQTITGIPVGSVCTVVEQDTGSFPPGSLVTYEPAEAPSPGVTIPGGPAGVSVTVTNDFSGIAVQTASLRIVKVVVATGPGVTLPASYTVHVSCERGTEVDVVLPGAGGEGTPIVTVKVGALCLVEEQTAALPPGWTVIYSVAGEPPTSEPPLFRVLTTETIEVTVINDPTGATTTTTTTPGSTTTTTPVATSTVPVPPTSGLSPGTGSGGSALPATGGETSMAVIAAGFLLLGTGLLAITRTTRRRRTRYG